MAYPVCPHCDDPFDAEDIFYGARGCKFPTERDEEGRYGDEQFSFDCPSCKKKLFAAVEYSPHWRFTDKDGEEI